MVLAREFLRTDQRVFLAGCQGIKPDFGDFGVIYFVSYFVLFQEESCCNAETYLDQDPI